MYIDAHDRNGTLLARPNHAGKTGMIPIERRDRFGMANIRAVVGTALRRRRIRRLDPAELLQQTTATS